MTTHLLAFLPSSRVQCVSAYLPTLLRAASGYALALRNNYGRHVLRPAPALAFLSVDPLPHNFSGGQNHDRHSS